MREFLFDASAGPAERSLAALEAAPATASTPDLVAAALDAPVYRVAFQRRFTMRIHHGS